MAVSIPEPVELVISGDLGDELASFVRALRATNGAALNREFRYQLTALGGPAPSLHVEREIANNAFTIAGGVPGQKVSWQVTGIR